MVSAGCFSSSRPYCHQCVHTTAPGTCVQLPANIGENCPLECIRSGPSSTNTYFTITSRPSATVKCRSSSSLSDKNEGVIPTDGASCRAVSTVRVLRERRPNNQHRLGFDTDMSRSKRPCRRLLFPSSLGSGHSGVGMALFALLIGVTSATFHFPTSDGGASPASDNRSNVSSAAGGVESRHLTSFPGFPSRTRCILPEGFLGVCLSLQYCAFMGYQLNQASETRDVGLWRHLRGFMCGFDRLQPKFCCPHPYETFYDFEDRPDEPYIQRIFAKAAEGGGGAFPGGTGEGSSNGRRTMPTLGVASAGVPPVPAAGPSRIPAQQPVPQPAPPVVAPPPKEDECGQQGVDFRIVGGNGSVAGEWPWAAAIGRKDAKTGRMAWGCGGALITATHVLTAAHCLPMGSEGKRLVTSVLKQYVVRLGDANILSENPEDEPQDFSVATATPHPQYERRPSFWNDIAVLRLSRPAQLGDIVSPVCVPLEPRSNEQLARESVIAIGWGSDGRKSTVDNLQTVALPVVPLARCRTRYEAFKIPLRDTQMCAGVEGRDTCKGDSGAPIMSYHPTRGAFEIVGITSIGSTACGGGLPGVYTKVDAYIEWIRDTIRKAE